MPPCTKNCPANVNCRGYVNLIREGRYREALELITQQLPFPGTIARICPHPCQTYCRNAVNISQLRMFIADNEKLVTPKISRESDKKIGIIGGGPAGLSAAFFLRKFGHQVSVYDSFSQMGGMLRYAIPSYRLPKNVLDREISVLNSMGVKLYNNTKVTDIESFRKQFDAVIIATGAWKSSVLNCEGDELTQSGLEFLLSPCDVNNKRVIVIGGGNTAMDVCRTAIRLCAKEVINVYRRTRNQMPAQVEEIEDAQAEGVQFMELLSPKRIIDMGTQKRMYFEKLAAHSHELIHTGVETSVDADIIIVSISQYPERFDNMPQENDGRLAANNFHTDIENVYAIGDLVNKNADRIAIKAISDGKIISDMINEKLCRKDTAVTENDFTYEYTRSKPILCKPLCTKKLPPSQRKVNFDEVVIAFTDKEAQREASRCLNCR